MIVSNNQSWIIGTIFRVCSEANKLDRMLEPLDFAVQFLLFKLDRMLDRIACPACKIVRGASVCICAICV